MKSIQTTTTIGFAGDFCPWRRIEQSYHDGTWQSILADAREIMVPNDLNVIDLECPLTMAGTPITKTGPHLRADPATAAMLPWLNCRLAATANNHLMDYGPDGLHDTQAALTANGVDWVGSGDSLAEAGKVYTTELNGLKFAIVNMAENEWTTTHGQEAGCNPLDLIYAQRTITEQRDQVDFIIVIIHGGHEHYALPSPRMQREARFMVDVGADAVVCHHTHVVSGYERYREKPIFYSLGNLCFDWGARFSGKPWNMGMILQLRFTAAGAIDFTYELIRQNDTKAGVYRLEEPAREQLEKEIQAINAIIADEALLQEKFTQYGQALAAKTMTRLEPYSNRYLAALHRRKLIPSLFSKQKQILLTNLVRCESHREVLLEVLRKENDMNK